jgi:hypothetical protein
VVLALRLTAPAFCEMRDSRRVGRDLPSSASVGGQPRSRPRCCRLMLGSVGRVLVPAPARCQETAPEAPAETPAAVPEYRVLVPVDDNAETIDYVFVLLTV